MNSMTMVAISPIPTASNKLNAFFLAVIVYSFVFVVSWRAWSADNESSIIPLIIQ